MLTWFASACTWECLGGLIAYIHLQRVCYGICLLCAGCVHLSHLWSSVVLLQQVCMSHNSKPQCFKPHFHSAKHQVIKQQKCPERCYPCCKCTELTFNSNIQIISKLNWCIYTHTHGSTCFCDVPDADMIREWLLFTLLAWQDERSSLSNNPLLFHPNKMGFRFPARKASELMIFFLLLWLQNNNSYCYGLSKIPVTLSMTENY